VTGRMDAVHVPVVDCTAPGPDAVMQFLAAVSGAGGPVYVHCEAGMGRTGVMVACYRIGQGWAAADARAEAAGFGCFLPDQLAFIETWTPTAGSGPVVVAPEALQQNRSGNADPEGLERALAAG
jgi:Tyrosine phosphatase family